MARNTFATFGILAILLLSVGIVSAAAGTTTENGITLTVNETALTNVITGEEYTFEVTVENNNGTDYNVSFGTSGWTWDVSGVTVVNGATETFIGTLTIGTTQSKSVIAKFYDMTDPTLKIFEVKETVTLAYLPILGCIDPLANNTDTSANTDDGSCTYDPLPQGCTDPAATNTNTTIVTENNSLCTYPPTPTPVTTWCEEDFANGEEGDLEIISIDVTNRGQGDDDLWEYLDKIEIEIVVENTNEDDSVDDVIIEIEIRDDDDNTYSKKKFDLNDDEEKVGRIGKDGDEETVTFTIDELPTDLDEGNYRLYVRAYEDDHEDEQCVSISDDLENDDDDETYFEFEVEASQDSTVIVSNNLDNIQASCGDKNVAVSFKVYNVGSNKEDKVLVNLYSSILGIDEYTVIDNLKDGSSKGVTFFVDIPTEVSKNLLSFDIFTFYDYDEDEDELDEFAYDEDSNDNGDDFSIGLTITSCKGAAPSINANLDSIAEVGEELIVKALITNNGNDDNDFVISVSNFEAWADLISVSPQTTSIKEGEFIEVMVVLKPHTAGTQSFTIIAIVDGESYTQQVSVKITEDKGLFTGLSDVVTYTIIAIIAVLVLIFLVLIAKVSRKSAKPQF